MRPGPRAPGVTLEAGAPGAAPPPEAPSAVLGRQDSAAQRAAQSVGGDLAPARATAGAPRTGLLHHGRV